MRCRLVRNSSTPAGVHPACGGWRRACTHARRVSMRCSAEAGSHSSRLAHSNHAEAYSFELKQTNKHWYMGRDRGGIPAPPTPLCPRLCACETSKHSCRTIPSCIQSFSHMANGHSAGVDRPQPSANVCERDLQIPEIGFQTCNTKSEPAAFGRLINCLYGRFQS